MRRNLLIGLCVLTVWLTGSATGTTHPNGEWYWRTLAGDTARVTYVPLFHDDSVNPYWREKFRSATDSWEPHTSLAFHLQDADGSRMSQRFSIRLIDDPAANYFGRGVASDLNHDNLVDVEDCSWPCVPDAAHIEVNLAKHRQFCSNRGLDPTACAKVELNTAIHELGHVLRLAHNDVPSVMNIGDWDRILLSEHDAADIQAYYPQ